MKNYQLEINTSQHEDMKDTLILSQDDMYGVEQPDIITIHRDQLRSVIELFQNYLDNGEM